jgi:predicted metal-dependent HD superfamily phosphohydrolase
VTALPQEAISEAEWVSEPVWISGEEKYLLHLLAFEAGIFQPTAQSLYRYCVPAVRANWIILKPHFEE